MSKIKRIISMLLAVIMLFSCIAFSLTSCIGDGGEGDGGGEGNEPDNKPEGDDPDKNLSAKIDYTVNVKTEGGMPIANCPVIIYTYADGALKDLKDFATTDANGKATFKVEGDVTGYAVTVDSELPKGYSANAHYPLVGTSLDISVETSLVKDESITGTELTLGDMMYDFTVTDVFGNRITLSELLTDKKMVLLNFWYVDCSACQLEFPYMKSVYEEYSDDVAIIALNPFDDELSIRSYAGEMGFEFEVVKDNLSIFQCFGVENYPTSVVIDRYGMVSLIEVGALPSERGFRVMFDHFIGEDYIQQKVESLDDITPIEYPDVEMPSSEEIADVFESGTVDAEYSAAEDDEMSWPFVIGEKDGVACIKTSNAGKVASYAQMIVNISLKAGEAVAFDYFSSTESDADILYVLVDGKDIFRISGESDKFETCYSYVALEDGEYELAFVYIKDGDTDVGEDTVYLKNLRIVSENDINTPTYIYRFASNKPNEYGEYQEYAKVVLGADGYYHVDSATGPILLASLVGIRTHFSVEQDIYTLTLGVVGIEDAILKYCNYASNSQINGVCPVNEELSALLKEVARLKGNNPHENTWLEICCYYQAYGTNEQLSDPIKGLAPFSAYEVELNPEGAGEDAFPNSVTYNRPIMPRGLFHVFRPAVSGVYQITSKSDYEVNAWIFKNGDFEKRVPWLTYDNVDRMNFDTTNCRMIAYLEAGTDYYINIAFYDVYQFGTIDFRVDRLGDAGVYRFSLASPGFFTYHENVSGSVNKIVSGGIDVVLGEDGIWREARYDGNGALVGSIIYADFTFDTNIFGKNKPIYSDKAGIVDLIESGAFNFRYSENDLYVLNTLAKNNGDVEKTKADLLAELGSELYGDYYVDELGNTNEGFAVDAVLSETYHGILGAEAVYDYSDRIREIAENDIIKAGYNETLKETILEGDARIGCVIVTEELANILQLLMDKYTFRGVENSWAKLCYYHEYFGPEATTQQ